MFMYNMLAGVFWKWVILSFDAAEDIVNESLAMLEC